MRNKCQTWKKHSRIDWQVWQLSVALRRRLGTGGSPSPCGKAGAPFPHRNVQSVSKRRCFAHFDLQIAPHRRAIFRHLNVKKWPENPGFWTFDWPICFAPQRRASCFEKWPEPVSFFTSRHSIVPFFHIETSKMAPNLRCFAHFDLTIASRYSRRLNFKNWLANVMWCFEHFDLKMRFAPQRRAILLHSYLRTAALPSLLFEHPEPRIIEETQRFATFLTFGACVSFLYLTSLVCFSTVHIVES